MTILTHDFTDSTALAKCSYDTEEKELSITFCSGRKYDYVDVPIETYSQLTEAKSAGKHFAAIKSGLTLK